MTAREDLIEKAAKALYDAEHPNGPCACHSFRKERARYVKQARAAFAVVEAAQPEVEWEYERMAAHKEAKKRYGIGQQEVRRRIAFEEGAVWAADFRRRSGGLWVPVDEKEGVK